MDGTSVYYIFSRISQKLEKRLLAFIILAPPSVCRLKHLGFHCADFHKIRYLRIYQKAVKK
jgi:hypothetical protein